MPGRYKTIRFRESDEKLIRNLVRSFNAKITRVSKANPNIADIQPKRLSVSDEIAYFKKENRAEFNRKVNQYKRYLSKGAEKEYTTKAGVRTTQWQIDEVRRDLTATNRERKARTKRNPDSEIDFPILKDLTETKTLKDWDKYVKAAERRLMPSYNNKLNNQYYENLMERYAKLFGENSRIAKRAALMNRDSFIKESLSNRILSFSYTYEMVEFIEKEQAIWDEFERLGVPEPENWAEPEYDEKYDEEYERNQKAFLDMSEFGF